MNLDTMWVKFTSPPQISAANDDRLLTSASNFSSWKKEKNMIVNLKIFFVYCEISTLFILSNSENETFGHNNI